MGIGVYVCDLLRRQLPAVDAGQTSWQEAFDGVLLFVDIAESSALTERFAAGTHGAEQLNRILNSYFGAVFDIVTSYGGDVISIEGDAVLAVWRTGGAGPGQVARRAAAAALELAARSGRSSTPAAAADLRHRVALSAGALTAGGLVDAQGRGFLVVTGVPVRALAELAHAGRPGEVVVTPCFAGRLEAAGAVGPGAVRDSRLTGMIAGPSDGPRQVDRVTGDDDHPGAARQFLPSFVGQRVAEGQAGWLAEFRELSAVCLTLPDLDPAAPDATEQIARALTVVGDAIAPLAAGVSELVVGDKGVTMVIEFGLPGEAREHNAGRAVEAAWRIRRALLEEHIVGTMGVATGRAFCGDVGSRTRRHVLVTGSLMHRGARLMQAAGPGQILVDEESWRLVAPTRGFAVGARELRQAKGFREPLAAYPLEVRRPRPDADGPRGRTPRARALRGRAHEIEVFETLLDGLADGRGALLTIEAEAGGGKTHLLDRLRAAATGRGLATLNAAGSPFQVLESYAGLRGLVRQLLTGADELGEATPTQLGARVLEALRDDPAEARAALISDILPLPFDEPGLAAQISGQARVAGLEDVLTGLLRHRRASRGPLVVFVDDLHWLDQPSTQLLAAVVRRLGDVLWVVASRPLGDDAGAGEWFTDAADRSLRLEPLAAAAVTAMVADLLGVDHVPARLGAFIRRRSGGLPFHAEQLTRVLVERALVTVEAGRCRVAAVDLEVQAVPQNLRELIVGRLDRLPPAQQVTVKVASVIGVGISGEAVRAIHPFPAAQAQVDAMLSALADAAVLTPVASTTGALAYDFTHATLREVTYDLLTLAQRQPLHRQLATFLEERHGDDLEPRLAELAQHWERADEPATAIDYRQRAAAQAIHRSANDDALVHLEHLDQLAAAAAIELPPGRRAELARLRGDACHELSRFDEADEWFRRCAGLSGIRVPATRTALVASLAVQAGTQLGHRLGLAGRLGLTHRRRAAADRARDQLAAHIFAKLSEHAYFNGDVLAILHTTLTSLNRAEDSAAVPEMVEALGGMAIGFGTAGRHRVARYYRRRAIARAEEDGTLHDQGFAHLLSAVYSFHAGDWAALDRHCEDGAAIFGVLGDRFRFQSCEVIRAYGDLMRGDYARAETGLGAFGADAEQVENVPVRAWVLAGLGLLDAVRGRAGEPVLRRIALARDDSMLHDAERLLCDGIRAAAELRAGHATEALQAASTGLANMRRNAPTMGIALFSVTAVADVHLSLVEPADPDPETLAAARAACRAARTYAGKIDICRPRERLVRGRLALVQGNRDAARVSFRQGVAEAVRHRMPLDEALCRLAWAEVGETTAEQHRQRRVAHAILERIGADPWLVWPRDAAYRG